MPQVVPQVVPVALACCPWLLLSMAAESSTASRERRRVALACKEMSSCVLNCVAERFQGLEEKVDLVLSGLALLLGDE